MQISPSELQKSERVGHLQAEQLQTRSSPLPQLPLRATFTRKRLVDQIGGQWLVGSNHLGRGAQFAVLFAPYERAPQVYEHAA